MIILRKKTQSHSYHCQHWILVQEDEESNYIKFDTIDASFQNNATLPFPSQDDKHREVNLQPEEFYYLS